MLFSIKNKEKKYETEDDIELIISEISQNLIDIKEIDISYNTFKPEAMSVICKYIKQMSNLEIVNLSGIFSTLCEDEMVESFVLLCNSLFGKKITVLDLSDNALSALLPKEFIELLSNANDLKVLQMRNCGLGRDGGNVIGDCLSALEIKDNLEMVDLAQNRFFEFPKNLSRGILSLTNLKILKLEYNTIEKNSMSEFLKNLSEHPLEVLDIRDNALTLDGCKTLGTLYNDWNIRELYVGACLMKNEGVKCFLQSANNKYVPLDLPGCIVERPSYITLDLSSNEFGQECIDLLINFAQNNNINVLRIYDNDFDDCEELVELVRSMGGTVEYIDPLLDDGQDDEIIEAEVLEMLGRS